MRFCLSITGVLVLLSACTYVLPEKSELERVHELYEQEFIDVQLPLPDNEWSGARDANEPPAVGGEFSKTLSAIAQYKLVPGQDARLAAHLTVLQGMIYLQTGRPGMARLLEPEIAAAASSLLTSEGGLTRDALFAQSFDALVIGWEEIWDYYDGDRATRPEWRRFQSSGDSIAKLLGDLPAGALGEAATYSGGLYLANTAAIFYLWAYNLGHQFGDPNDSDVPPPEEGDLGMYAARGRDAMKPFLTNEEVVAAASTDSLEQFATSTTGRFRYLAWYAWLNENSQASP